MATVVAQAGGWRLSADDDRTFGDRDRNRPTRARGASAQVTLRGAVRDAVARAWDRAVSTGALPAGAKGADAAAIEIDRPAKPEHGDAATNLALRLARPYKRSPLDIAGAIARELTGELSSAPGTSPIGQVEVAAPGFINLRYADRALEATVERVLAAPGGWGHVASHTPRNVNVEFVSANPTGPLTIGNARGAFVGDLLSRVLEAAGHRVTREYYFNDSGGQVWRLGASVIAARRSEPIPEDGYHGGYVRDLAAELPGDVWAQSLEPGADATGIVGRWASERIRAGIEASLEHLGVRFDVWTTERSLHEVGWVARAIERLREGNHVYEEGGALWFRSTAFGDDKDRVILRSNGEPTYFASDLGYVTQKFSRGFDELIYIWGEDHHGTVARVRNAAEAMGYDKSLLRMLLIAWVRFVRNGVDISMSKRAGTFITLDELLAEIGVDAARWFFGSRSPSSAIDFDIELAKRQSNENPVYYVQYAHARIASILRKASEAGLSPSDSVAGWLTGAPEAALVRQIVRLPEVVEDAAAIEETQGVTAYATELATTFHAFYRDARVIDPGEPSRTAARLALVAATRTTLANTLGLLGISAPDQM